MNGACFNVVSELTACLFGEVGNVLLGVLVSCDALFATLGLCMYLPHKMVKHSPTYVLTLDPGASKIPRVLNYLRTKLEHTGGGIHAQCSSDTTDGLLYQIKTTGLRTQIRSVLRMVE